MGVAGEVGIELDIVYFPQKRFLTRPASQLQDRERLAVGIRQRAQI